MINKNLIEKSQIEWGNGIIEIGKLKQNRLKCEEYTKSFLYRMYDFNNSKEILFKPTKAKIIQFRSSFEKALSYFIGGENAVCSEDKGFALEPWSKVKLVDDFGDDWVKIKIANGDEGWIKINEIKII